MNELVILRQRYYGLASLGKIGLVFYILLMITRVFMLFVRVI